MRHVWRNLFRRQQVERELSEELESVLELLVEAKVREGLSPADARCAARIELGGVEQIKENVRDVRGGHALESAWQELRLGVRMLVRYPGFTTMAVLTLALGIGANTAIFQLLDAVRLRALPVHAPRELVELRLEDMDGAAGGIGRSPSVTNPIWEEIRNRQQAFSGVFAWGTDTINLAPGGEVRPARALYVSGDMFRTLGVRPELGRLLTVADDQRGCGASGVVLSSAFWQREYGGDRGVVGRTLNLGGQPFEIIGVTPASFFGMEVGRSFDIALPLCAVAAVRGNDNFLSGIIWWLTVTGRLKPDWSPQQAGAHAQALSPGIFEASLPPNHPPDRVQDYLGAKLIALPAGSGISELRDRYERSLWLLLAIAGLVLLIACSNVANLLLARANARQREIAVRQALGASRGRLVRQLLIESLLLAALGAALGAAVAQTLSRVLVAFLGTTKDRVFLDLAPDWRILGFTAALAVLTCLLFGLAPAIRATRTVPVGRGVTAGRERFSLARTLVVVQVALSLVLVAGAILFTRSLQELMTVDTGFRAERVLLADVVFKRLDLPPERYTPFKEELLGRIRAIPGVEAAAIAHEVPLRGFGGGNVVIDGRSHATNLSRIGSDYFETLRIPLLAGRDFDARDRADTPKVAIVNQAFARAFLGGASPAGRRFHIAAQTDAPHTQYEIVGLVRDTKYADLREEFVPIVYTAAAQDARSGPGGNVLVRSTLPESETAAAVRRVLEEIHPAITVSFQGFQPMIEATIRREQLMATLSGFFGVLALLLACVGLYGVLSYNVTTRASEIGVRMALGARSRDVSWLILRETLLLVIAGVAVGMPLVVAVTRLASTLLFGLSPTDPPSLALAALSLFAAALVASYVPARRASRLDPMVAALRCE